MVKSAFSMIIVSLIIVFASVYESNYVAEQFIDFDRSLEVLYLKIDDESATKDDVYAVQSGWINKKQRLHVFIPHNEIKEIDLWLAEAVTLVEDKKWQDALSKIEVLRELAEQIPKTFAVSLDNIL